MKIKSTLLALLAGAAIVVGACGGSTASPAFNPTKIEDLKGLIGCVGESTTHETWLNGGFATSTVVDVFNAPPADVTVKTYTTDYLCIEAYLAGRNEWQFMAQSKEFLDKAIAEAAAAGKPLRYLNEDPNFAGRISFALDKGGPATASMIRVLNEMVASMHADGTLSEFSMTHLGRDVTKKPGDTSVATDLAGKTYCEVAIAAGEPTDSLLGKICAAGKIVVATDPVYPPYSSLNDSGEYVGFDSDSAREVAKRLGVSIEWATPDWSVITAGSWAGRWDISIGSMTQTEERAAVVDFVDPYFYESGYIVVAAE
jgi:ABC-type amino acid transport substrate-binding protein